MPVLQCPIDGCEWKSQDLGAEFAAALTAALQIHDRTVHTALARPAPQKLKLDPPSITAGCDPDQWSAFTRQWDMYKVGMSIADNVLATALFYCCNSDLRTDIMRDIQGDVANMAEADLLGAIKRLAVKDESTLVHRIKLNRMTQSPGTGIRTFLASLRGQASLCQYKATCKEPGCAHVFDFSDEIIKDNLVRGIADPEIMSDLLGDPKTDRTLEETVSFIAQKEQGKVTKSAVGDSAGAMYAARSSQKPAPVPGAKCWACGGPAHGQRNDRKTRSRNCEAWTFTCGKCATKGHYTKCCSKCTTCGLWGHRDSSSRACRQGTSLRNPPNSHVTRGSTKDSDYDKASYVFDQLCSTSEQGRSAIRTSQAIGSRCQEGGTPLEHYIYDGQWVARPSKPHPMILVNMTPLPEEHALFGHPMRDASELKSITMSMVADTGCQSTIIPLQSAKNLGIKEHDLLPVKLVMRGAIREDLGVMGAIVVNIATCTVDGSARSTRLLCYVSDAMEKAFLCREALVSLGIIHTDFPQATAETSPDINASMDSCENITCSCPRRRQEPPPMPTTLPNGLSATEDNVEALKEWLLDYYSATTFNVCEHQPLPLMKCEPLQLHVDPSAPPVAVHKPALVPIHWQDKVYADLERDVRIGVLERVDSNTPTTWCSRMVVTGKADGTPRRTVDLQPQNRHSVRQTHHVPSPFHLADRVPQGMKKTVTDAWNGYHSVPIREEDRHFTTFITPWGRYRYKVAPQGFMASGDAYNQRFDAIIADFKNKVKCVDDTCMWENSIEAAFFQACEWFDLCARNGITLNPKKFQFAQDTVDFAGLTITPTNIRPSTKFLDAIRHFPTPSDITGARAWFGLINQGAYAFAMTRQMKPFRALLKPSAIFQWTNELDELFHHSKEVIIQEMKEGVRLFDPTRLTCLATDWSVDGIGFFLMQKYCHCESKTPACCPDGWKLCLVGSRFTHPAESRYAPIEGEALAVVYALHQTRYYILGCKDLIVATDHKPLLQILNDRSLTDIDNRRLLNLKEKTLGYRFSIVHVPGKRNLGPDAASRHPAGQPDRLLLPGEAPETDTLSNTTEFYRDTLTRLYQHAEDNDMANDSDTVAAASSALNAIITVVTWDMVREATASDPTFVDLVNILEAGFPEDCRELPVPLRPFHRFAAGLCVVDGVVLMGQRIVIPPVLRKPVLNALHAAHQGVSAMRARAMDSVYWPDISIDIARVREQCVHCHKMAKSNPMQPPSDITPPDYPFQMICSDYFTYNSKDYVVIVDRYSNWPMVHRSESGAEGLIKRLRETFVTFGIPEELTSDGGPQFTAGKTQEFLKAWGVRHRITSVANPHANCRAELAVKTVKRMLMDNVTATGSLDVDKFQRALLMYRNSVDPETKSSPALILFGRPIRDAIPILRGRYSPHETWTELMSHREMALARRHSRDHERWNEHTHRLPPLQVGDHVYLQNLVGNHPRRWERTGTVVEVRQYHQYVIRVDGTGRVTIRNRQHLRKFTPFHGTPLPGLSVTPAVERPQQEVSNCPPPSRVTPQVSMPLTPSLPPGGSQTPLSSSETPTKASPSESIPGRPTRASTPRQTTQSTLEPKRLSFDQSDHRNSSPDRPMTSVPRALARLQPYNKAGTKELLTSRRPCRRDNNE
ncbi:uncharacterized protein LOC128203366 [Mya arenaria]|uniref:uncharacterized protein LOC128203366 n=1 Tax=Mya arenaria TaxID=6604 RepID=UPI0022DEC562|nr:uncharacterized protein LOC128203366 [Mya arenaria]